MAFVGGEGVPVFEVFGKIDLFGGPEGGFGLLVHLPDLVTTVKVCGGGVRRVESIDNDAYLQQMTSDVHQPPQHTLTSAS